MLRKILSMRSLVFLFVATGVLVGTSAQALVMTREQKVWTALSKLEEIQSVSFDGSVNYFGKVNTKYKDLLLETVPSKKSVANYESLTVEFKGGRQTFTPTESQSWVAFSARSADKKAPAMGIELRSVGGNNFAALTTLDNMPAGVDTYKYIWVKLDFKSLLKGFDLDAILDKESVAQDIYNKEELKNTRDLILKSKILNIRSVSVKKLNGLSFDVYNFSVNQKNLKNLIAVSMALNGRMLATQELATLNKEMTDAKSVSGQIWIGKKDGYPYRLSMNIIGNQPKEKTSINLNFKNFNQPVTVSEPTSYITTQELMNKLFPGLSQFLTNTSTTTTVPAMW